MKLNAITEVLGDQTRTYLVEDYVSHTVGEFIQEVIKENPKEFGYFKLDGSTMSGLRAEYKYGKLLNTLPSTLLEREIYFVTSNGGWSLMNYTIYTTT